MVKIDEELKKQYDEYLIRHRTFEKIDSAILEYFGNQYRLFDNQVPLHTNVDVKVSKKCFETDLVYVSEDRKAVLCIEETMNPTNKKEQLLAYGNISPQTLRLLTGTDLTPHIDVFLVFPQDYRQTALNLYNEIKVNVKKIGKEKGISLWGYPPSLSCFNCVGGSFSEKLSTIPSELKSRGIGTIKILKNAPTPFLLQFTVIRAMEDEYGKTTDGIEFNKEKFKKWLTPYGIVAEGKWREMIKLGELVGWFENVSIEQLTGSIKYTKVNPTSIAGSKNLTSNFFQAIEDDEDKKQKSIFDFSSNDKDVENDEDPLN